MSDTSPFGFGKFVPGFDFLQNLTKGTSGGLPHMPSLSSWVAPTLSVEELDKRVTELKAVQFWLEQNSRALAATIQALEVQKMTLATLKGMNFSMGDVANAFKLKTTDAVMDSVHKAGETLAGAAHAMGDAAARAAEKMAPESAAPAAPQAAAKDTAEAPASVVDPMQWWGALTQQFQQIASTALTEAAKQGALDTTRHMATDLAKEAFKTATDIATKGVQSVQEATRRAASAASAATTAPAPVRKTTAAKATTAAKDTTSPPKPVARKSAATPAAAPAAKKAVRRPATKSAR